MTSIFSGMVFLFLVGVKMPRTGGGFEFNFIAHDGSLLDGHAGSAQLGKHGFDAIFVDGPQRGGRQTQINVAIFAFNPNPATLQIRQKAPFGAVVGVGHIVAHHRLFAGNHAFSGHSTCSNS